MNINEFVELTKMALAFFALAAASFSALTACKAYKVNLRKTEEDRVRDRDKELLAQIENSLKWAYDSLTEDGKSIPVKADRLNWLTCARHLLRANTLSMKIVSETYRTIRDEKEEFWRHRFYLALRDISFRNPGFFENGYATTAGGGPIEPRSAKVIIEFSAWRNGAEDPIDSVENGPISHEDYGKSSASMGLNEYLALLEQRRRKNLTETK